MKMASKTDKWTKTWTLLHLSVLEAIFIKTLSPILCRQKEFVYNLTFYRINLFFLNSFVFRILSYTTYNHTLVRFPSY